MSCFQCACDIPHVCYHGISDARWGLNDNAMAALEAAQRYLNPPPREKVTAMPAPAPALCIPDGWTLEALPRAPDQLLISTPPPMSFMATIDFKGRGFRTGFSTTGMFVGEAWNKQRKKYGGRGWQQAIVDDAVAHLKTVLE